MRVVVAKGETVELATGGRLESMTGVLRIRERKDERGRNENKAVGSLVFVPAAGDGDERSPAKFQINISMSAAKFEPLLRVAMSGRLPTKFFVDAGERVSARETRGMCYAIRAGVRTKFWDNKRYRTLQVTNFAVILPISVPDAPESPAFEEDRAIAESLSTNEQVAELVDDCRVPGRDEERAHRGRVGGRRDRRAAPLHQPRAVIK